MTYYNLFSKSDQPRLVSNQQSGVVLFVALIALVAMSLAAVSLIRSVDSNNMIAGNLSLKQAATSSADAGVEAAISALSTIRDSNTALSTINSDAHPINKTDTATYPGFHSNLTKNTSATGYIDIKSATAWNNTNSKQVTSGDSVDNEVRYIIQRMCRNANQAPANSSQDCVYSAGLESGGGDEVPLANEICSGDGCPTAGQAPLYRITVRVKDYKDSLTYVQAIVH